MILSIFGYEIKEYQRKPSIDMTDALRKRAQNSYRSNGCGGASQVPLASHNGTGTSICQVCLRRAANQHPRPEKSVKSVSRFEKLVANCGTDQNHPSACPGHKSDLDVVTYGKRGGSPGGACSSPDGMRSSSRGETDFDPVARLLVALVLVSRMGLGT